jgi:hypothetical protein
MGSKENRRIRAVSDLRYPPQRHPISRRQAIKRLGKFSLASFSGLSLLSCQKDISDIVEPEESFDFAFDASFNVHSDNSYNGIQLNCLNSLRAQWLRISIPYSNLYAARPFTGRGCAVLGVITEHEGRSGFIERLSNKLQETLMLYFETYPSIQHWQLLNEPTHFYDMSATDYVKKYLAPAARFIRTNYPHITIISAAPVGTSQGPILMAEMAAAGLENHCDRVGVHIYNPVTIIEYATYIKKRIWVTETGVADPMQHIAWARDTLNSVRGSLKPERIFWYTLWDRSQYSLININEEEGVLKSTSPLYDLLVNRTTSSMRW